MTNEEEEAANEAQSLDNNVSISVLLALSQGGVDNVAKVWLEADVKETEEGEHSVDPRVADRVIEASGNENILNRLQELHSKEEEDPTSKLRVASSCVHPPRREYKAL